MDMVSPHSNRTKTMVTDCFMELIYIDSVEREGWGGAGGEVKQTQQVNTNKTIFTKISQMKIGHV